MKKQNLTTINEDSKLVQRIRDLAVDYRPVDIKRLCKAITNEEQLANFELFHNMLKRAYAPSLIGNLYIKHKDNARAIVEMHNKLKGIGLVTPSFSLHVDTLNKLNQLIASEQDFINFTHIYEESKYRCGILMWIKLFKDGKALAA